MNQNIKKQFFKFVLLGVAGMIGMSMNIMADTFFVSRGLGPQGLASLNLAISMFSIVNGVGYMIGIGAATRYTIHKAQEEHQKANQVFTSAVVMGLAAGLFFALLGLFFSGQISVLLGADSTTFTGTSTYLKTVLLFAPVYILNSILQSFVQNDSRPKLSTAGIILGNLSNIVLDYIFIFPLGLGMFGAALATGLGSAVGILVMLPHLFSKSRGFHLQKPRLEGQRTLDICRIGLPSLVTELSSGVVLIVFNLIILSLEGNTGVAAYSIVANLSLVAAGIFTGISRGVQPLVSNSYGCGNREQVRTLYRMTMITAFVTAAIVYLLVYGFTDPLIAVFNSQGDATLATLARSGIRVYFTGFFFAGFSMVATALLSASEQAGSAFLISVTRGFFAILPSVVLLSGLLGIAGVWLSFPVAELATAVLAAVLLLRGQKHICHTATE